ncbi:MAG: hypothetical protein R3199_00410 [Gemmatimonadota bacterium]|nr:hypothetical protein [Gemmatimonadota bacterium]
MNRSWIWMIVFSAIFLVIGAVELARGEGLAGTGYLLCGGGAALETVGQRRSGETGSDRWLSISGVVAMAVGIVLLVIHLFG